MKTILAFFTLILISFTAFTQRRPVNQIAFTQFVKDIALTQSDPGHLRMAMWFPNVYWEMMSYASPSFTPEMAKEISKVMDDYVLVCVVEAEMNYEAAQFESLSEKELRKTVSIEHGGKTYKPVPTNNLPEEAQMIKEIVEPLFAQMLGDLGNGITIFYFDISDSRGNNLVDEYKKDIFSIHVGGAKLTYNLPLPSLYENKVCPEDGVEFQANYTYCPFHGTELQEIATEEIKISTETNSGE